MQLLDDERHKEGKNPLTSAGALYGLLAPTNKTILPVGEFNHARLIVRGNHIEHWLNYRRILVYTLNSDSLKNRIADSKFNEFPQFMHSHEGHIGLQHHGEEVWFRNIRIRRLAE